MGIIMGNSENGSGETPFVRMRRRYSKRAKMIAHLRELVDIQGQSGNWNYDPYMHGMYNGMELMLAIVEDRDPVYREAPEQWLAENLRRPDNHGSYQHH